MPHWLYQIDQSAWPPGRYRLEIWEGERWAWPVGRLASKKRPQAGDTVTFFCAPSRGSDPGFYGWAVVTEFYTEAVHELYFVPVAPSDALKMMPWWNAEARKVADEIRGRFKQGTMWLIDDTLRDRLRRGIREWIGAAPMRET